jgi:hypothetical protein
MEIGDKVIFNKKLKTFDDFSIYYDKLYIIEDIEKSGQTFNSPYVYIRIEGIKHIQFSSNLWLVPISEIRKQKLNKINKINIT